MEDNPKSKLSMHTLLLCSDVPFLDVPFLKGYRKVLISCR